MNVAQSLSQWKELSPEQWLRAANRFLPPAVTAVLVIAIAHRLAEITWLATPRTSFDRPAPVIVHPTSERTASTANFSALADSDLFGKAPEAPVEEPVVVETVVDAPDTTLNIRLTGVAADEDGKLSLAIVASGRSDERKYRIGQEIENTNGATLHAVYPDRVILNRGGRLEALRLPKEPSPTAATAAASRIPPARQPVAAPAAPVEGPTFRDLANENASRLTDIMRLAPQYEGGTMIGFRVNPGRNRQAFEALGLQPGDVVTQINGMVLDDPNRALQVFEALGESVQAEVTVVREGVPNVLVVDTTQIQNIAEGRQ